jgi:hypothetical protein
MSGKKRQRSIDDDFVDMATLISYADNVEPRVAKSRSIQPSTLGYGSYAPNVEPRVEKPRQRSRKRSRKRPLSPLDDTSRSQHLTFEGGKLYKRKARRTRRTRRTRN